MTGDFSITLTNGEEVSCKLSNRAIYNLDRYLGQSFLMTVFDPGKSFNLHVMSQVVYRCQIDGKYKLDELVDLIDVKKMPGFYQRLIEEIDAFTDGFGVKKEDAGIDKKK